MTAGLVLSWLAWRADRRRGRHSRRVERDIDQALATVAERRTPTQPSQVMPDWQRDDATFTADGMADALRQMLAEGDGRG